MNNLTTLTATRDAHRQIVKDLIDNAKENGTQNFLIETETKLLEKLDKEILIKTVETANVEEIKQEIEKVEKYKTDIGFAIQNYKNIISNKAVNEPKHVMQMVSKVVHVYERTDKVSPFRLLVFS